MAQTESEVTSAVTMQPASNAIGQQVGTGPAPHAPLPGSPTLTNPDMILPDYDDGALSLDRAQSPLMMWKNANGAGMGFNLSPEAFTAGPIAPTTPIIYGNGTMLSDIGEVTEVESTCGPSRSRSGSTRSEMVTVTSTALPYEAIKQRIKQSRMAHQRQMSIESNSTVTAHGPTGLFTDFDDTVSVDDSNFQGDDEDSVADSYIDDGSVQETISQAKELSFSSDETGYSTPLSRRAEQILANAKRRLTTMEGNLHRARSTLQSPASLDSQSTPSPPVGAPGTDHRTFSHGHNRISSESNIPTESKPGPLTQRSSSALGTAGGYRRPSQGSRNASQVHNSTNGASSDHSIYGNPVYSNSKYSLHGHDRSLEPLSEDGVYGEKDAHGQDAEGATADVYPNSVGSSSDKDLKRSASSAQMRDIKDQVNDLKGRLSTLRDQARADSLQRRSLQSLRTPSPFTHARVEQWYADTGGVENSTTQPTDSNAQITTESITNPNQTENSAEMETPLQRHDESQTVLPDPAEEFVSATLLPNMNQLVSPIFGIDGTLDEANVITESVTQPDDVDYVGIDDGYQPVDTGDYDDSASESGASSYHDSVQAQVSHEDREDAFDYEHFFLHSAMGSMSRRRMRHKSSTDSFSSEDSVETTRGPTTSQSAGVVAGRPRRGSTESTSTIDSFATATEGRHTRVGYITPQEYADEYNDGYGDEYPDRRILIPERARTHTPDTAKRMVFSPEASDSGSDPRRSQSSLHRRPQSSAAAFQHRSSASSLSAGTNRSFPLIAKSKRSTGVLTPSESPDQGLRQISEAIMHEAANIYEQEHMNEGENRAPMQMLQKDDQILVERLVASLGRCVLGLTESGRASAEGRAYRRKIEAARRALEGFE
ncbi:hypothetical protein F4777DRAFT_256244 [Nemania sp. FL0916]|nr:hypothetical protein F4777DRAFT_256244 [Nemania sp. FL0916]